MKKTALFALLFAMLTAFISCEGNENLPEGMQLVRGGDDVGYYFYAPEEWTVANNGQISAVYASKIDITSITFAPISAPMGDIQSYFENSLSDFAFELSNQPQLDECDFGNADAAYKTVYDFEYESHPFRAMQIFVRYGERYYIFTYTAQLADRTEGESYYAFYLSKAQSVIDNFRFSAISSNVGSTEYTTDADGYKLVSDPDVCGYELYVHPDWQIRYTQSNIGISASDGASANITEATSLGMSRDEYWENRKAELSAFVSNLTVIGEKIETSLGNSTWAFAYEYTYEYSGETYHVYQIIAVAGEWPMQNGYVFTYTAPESAYASHLEEFNKMVEKVNFK